MTAPLAVLTRRIPPAGLDALDAAGVRVEIVEPDATALVDADRLLDAAARADVLISLLTERIDERLLALPGLRGVANMAVGFNNIDISAATAMGVPVTNTPGVLTDTTADFTWALLLGIARQVTAADAYMRSGRYRIWGPELLLGGDVSTGGTGERKILGIVGFGRIGRAVARRAAGFDMNVIAHRPGRDGEVDGAVRFVSLEDLLQQSDFVSIHAPANTETHHMIGEAQLRRMKPTAYLINVARGELVDEAALVRALQGNWIAGAALDVFEHEPAMAHGLAQCPNVLLAPHIGSASIDTRNRMSLMAAENAIAHLRGQRAVNVVNAAVYETAAYHQRMTR